MTIYEIAKKYIKKRISVIPVAKDKRPLVNWKEYQTRYATDKELKEWFEDKDVNIGIITGKISNITVIDIEKGGKVDYLPDTLISKTGGGGYHYFYQYNESLNNKVRIKELTDIRNNGGFVIIPPSISEKGEYTWLNSNDMKPFPISLFKNIDKKKINIPEYKGVGQGQRNDEMIRYAGKIIPLIHPSDWNTEGLQILKDVNQKNNPPLNEFELDNIFKFVCEKEKENPSFRKEFLNKEEKEQDIDNDVLPMYEVADLYKKDKQTSVYYETGYGKLTNALGGGFKNGNLVIITGETGQGKTLFSQSLTCNMSKKNIPVLFFSYEVTIDDIWDKFVSMGMGKSSVVFCPIKNTTGKVDWLEKNINLSIDKYNTKVVVIDHLGFLLPKIDKYSGHIASNQDAYLTSICRDLKTIAINKNIVIVLLAHLRKTDNPSLRDLKGSSGIAQESDVVLIVKRVKNNSYKENDDSDLYEGTDTNIILEKNRFTGKTIKLLCHLLDNKLVEKYDIGDDIVIDKKDINVDNIKF